MKESTVVELYLFSNKVVPPTHKKFIVRIEQGSQFVNTSLCIQIILLKGAQDADACNNAQLISCSTHLTLVSFKVYFIIVSCKLFSLLKATSSYKLIGYLSRKFLLLILFQYDVAVGLTYTSLTNSYYLLNLIGLVKVDSQTLTIAETKVILSCRTILPKPIHARLQ